MKTSVKHLGQRLGPRPGNVSQNDPKTTCLMTSITKNPQAPMKKNFLGWNLKSHLRPWTAL